jgi:deazaflavin-dependent oxidoreductase (nitroreductase family)
MERYYRLSLPRRLVNLLVRPLVRTGLILRHTYVLSVPGRRTGRRYSTPVTLVENGGRWLVAPYGERSWVKNARAAGWVELSRAGRTERVAVREAEAAEAAPVLRRYVEAVPVTRRFFDARPGAPLAEFEAEAHRHPVFRIEPADSNPEPPK